MSDAAGVGGKKTLMVAGIVDGTNVGPRRSSPICHPPDIAQLWPRRNTRSDMTRAQRLGQQPLLGRSPALERLIPVTSCTSRGV